MRRKHALVLVFGTLLLSLLFSCNLSRKAGENNTDNPLFSTDTEARDLAYRSAQTALVNNEALSRARGLISSAERKRSEDGGFVRESIDFSQGNIRYYAASADDRIDYSVTGTENSKALEIVDYGPAGELPIENRRPNIYVMFNQPMIPMAKLGSPIDDVPYFKIEPPIDGRYRWYGTKTLGFQPEKDLLEEPKYRVTVSDQLHSLTGEALEDDFSFDIFGERVKMVNMFPGNNADIQLNNYDVPMDLAQMLTVEFNQPVEPQTIAQSISVVAGSTNMDFTVRRPDYPERLKSRTDRAVLLVLDSKPEENSRVVLTLEKGAKPFPDYPATQTDQSFNLWTIQEFHAERLSAYEGSFPGDNRSFSYPVQLMFSHPLDENTPLPEIPVKIDGKTIVPGEVRKSWSSVTFYIPGIKPGQELELSLPPGILDIYGRECRTDVLKTLIPRPSPFVDFPYSYGGLRHLEAEFKPSLVWSSRNIVEAELGIKGMSNYYNQPDFSPKRDKIDLDNAARDFTVFHEENLQPHLSRDGYGTVYFNYLIRKDPSLVSTRRQWEDGNLAVQVTDIGISVRVAYNRVLVWANRLSNGEPVANADVSVFNLLGKRYQAVTDSSGLASIPVPKGEFAQSFYNRSGTRSDSVHVSVEKDGDLAEFRVQNTNSPWAFGVYNVQGPENAEQSIDRIHMFTDRGLYKGGEELAFRGIHWKQNPQGFESYRGPYKLQVVETASGGEIFSTGGTTSDSGGFFGRFRLPENLEPGNYQLVYEGEDFRDSLDFRIASFRRVAFQVESSIEQNSYFHGDTLNATVKAGYLSGGALPSASYHYYWTRKPVSFTPPGSVWEDWSFGTSSWAAEQTLSSGDGNLSAAGFAKISEATSEQEITGKAYRYTLETTVEDIDRQTISSVSSTIVHPSRRYIAARIDQGSPKGWWSRFVPTGQTVKARAKLVDIDGVELAENGLLTIGLIRGEWKSVDQQGLYGRINTRWEYVEEELWQKNETIKKDGVEIDLAVENPGSYKLFFESVDGEGRTARTEIEFYATGSGWVQRASRTPSDINFVVDKELYKVGETARILVQSPLPRGRYLLSIEREGILDQKIIELEGSNEIIEIPILEEYLPVFYVALSGFTERTAVEKDYFEPDLGRPRGLFGLTTIRVATDPVELDVEVVSSKENYGPGEEADISVKVEKNGQAVSGAEVMILAVDRGVLDLIDYHIPNPLDYFYSTDHFPHAVMGDDSRRLLLRPVTYEISNLQGGESSKLEVRKDFNPLAVFEPNLRTGNDGTVNVKVKLPDNLSSYRLTAIAIDDVNLGFNENQFRVSNPVNIRTALPRRFRNRDSVAAGLVLTNTSDEKQRLNVSVESNILGIAGKDRKTVVLEANSSTELPFILEALKEGEGTIRFTIRSEVVNEILEEKIIVERPLVSESFTSVGVVSEDGTQESIIIPEKTGEGFGNLALRIDAGLRPYIDASIQRLETLSYPSINERLYIVMASIVSGHDTNGSAELFEELANLQFPNGGIAYRPPSRDYSKPNWFLSALTAQLSLELSRYDTSFSNPLDMDALLSYLGERLSQAEQEQAINYPAAWSAWILAENGRIASENLAWLDAAGDSLGISGMNLLAQAYAAIGENSKAKRLYERSKNFMILGTQSVSLRETYEKARYFSTAEMELALFLKTATIMREEPELILRIASALDGDRHSRRFHSSFDDFWIINGFKNLLVQTDPKTSNTVKVSLGTETLIEASLNSNETQSINQVFQFTEPPLSSLKRGESHDMSMSQSDNNKLYYAATLNYAIPIETAMARDEGIEVFSQIETLDGQILDETNLPLGETLRMRVSISTLSRRSYLNLLVPIPSGAEIVDPSFATSGRFSDAGGTGSESWNRETVYGDTAEYEAEGYIDMGFGDWNFRFYQPAQTVYDNAIKYSWDDFYPGQREISFLLRTTTPGVYPTPPVSASLEFEPEVFGRTNGRLVIIRGE